MKKLSPGQRRILAEFCANMAVVWLGSGIVAPLFISKLSQEVLFSGLFSALWAIFLLVIALRLLKGLK